MGFEQKPETVDEKELLSIYRVAKNKNFQGTIQLRFDGDGKDAKLKLDLVGLHSNEAKLLLANKKDA
jgi:hypothetical protein